METVQELRIRADMARSLGHEDVARGIDIAIAAMTPQPIAPEPAPQGEPRRRRAGSEGWEKERTANGNRRWSLEENTDLCAMWTRNEPIEVMMRRFGRSHRSVVAQALYKLKLPHRTDIRTHATHPIPAEARTRGDLLNV